MRLLITLIALSTIFDGAGEMFNKYVFADWDFVPFLVLFIVIDTCTGLYANWKTRKLHSFKMRSLYEKLQMYAVGLVIVHGVAAHLVDGSPNLLVQQIVPYLKGAFYVFMLFCEALSIEENLQKTGKGYLPKWIKSKMQDFKETGKVPSSEPEQPVL